MSTTLTETDVRVWLRDRFGHEALREGQAKVVRELLRGRRVVFVAPTGHGKSLCYQALAAHPSRSGVVLVFQPLKALMAEQVKKAEQLGLRARFVNSDLGAEEQDQVLKSAADGELDLLFLAPERQGNSLWLDAVADLEIKGVVIDEAHCISQWGHDFRPWYRRLVNTTMALGRRTPVLATTATAPGKVIEDIESQVSHGQDSTVIRLPSHRPNLSCGVIEVRGVSERLGLLLALAGGRFKGQPGIVYTLTTQEAERVAVFLRGQGVPALCYYGRLSPEEKTGAMETWVAGEAQVMVATSALGMGLDRADVRWIVHLGMPESLIRYVQEIGRAGRDGQFAHVIAVHDRGLKPIYDWLVQGSYASVEDHRALAKELQGRFGATRKKMILATDIPEAETDKILGDWLMRGLVERRGQPYFYTWRGGLPILPEGLDVAEKVRREFLDQAFKYVDSADCRSACLAEAMKDETLPALCGECDRCCEWPAVDYRVQTEKAQRYLETELPPIKLRNKGPHGIALSRYGEGPIGRAVRDSKTIRGQVPRVVMDEALRVLKDPRFSYTKASMEAVVFVPSTVSGDYLEVFACALAKQLGVPLIKLNKVRETRAQKNFRSKTCKKENVKGAFAWPTRHRGVGSVLLIDDIWHTGETMKEAARAVRHCGAEVLPLVLAHTRRQA